MALKIISKEIQIEEETGSVYFINGEGKLQKIGELFERQFTCKRKPQHIFRKLNAFGFNLSLIKEGVIDSVKVIVSDGRVLNTTAKEMLEKGKKDSYSNNNDEEQIFMPLPFFN